VTTMKLTAEVWVKSSSLVVCVWVMNNYFLSGVKGMVDNEVVNDQNRWKLTTIRR
jgi:hypothetical protein